MENASSVSANNYLELSFVVPWGQIAGKGWNDPCGKPVLLIHGRQDNAGSFDRLVALLPKQFYYVCIDLPGHGYSTRFPKGVNLDLMIYIGAIRRVVKQLKWEQFCYIGHSLGGQLGTYYAAMYPDIVLKLIVLDAVFPYIVPEENYLRHTRTAIERMIELEEKLKTKLPPLYTYEDALERLITGRPTPITTEAAEALLPRALKPHKNGYYFSMDQRLKFNTINAIDSPLYLHNMSKIKCPYLLVLTETTYAFVMNPDLLMTVERDLRRPLNVIEVFKENPDFQLVIIEGWHDVHNTEPNKVAPLVEKFLLSEKSHL